MPLSERAEKFAEYKKTGWFSFDVDHFGVRRDYSQIPTFVPDEEISAEEACDGA
ncbi:hypothetical protein EV121DRAFT_298098, partial [Schizophyllum commune]